MIKGKDIYNYAGAVDPTKKEMKEIMLKIKEEDDQLKKDEMGSDDDSLDDGDHYASDVAGGGLIARDLSEHDINSFIEMMPTWLSDGERLKCPCSHVDRLSEEKCKSKQFGGIEPLKQHAMALDQGLYHKALAIFLEKLE